MSQIGSFRRDGAGFIGRIQTLTFDAEVVLIPCAASDAENAPDYRLHLRSADGPDVGAAWKRSGEKAGDYLSLELDDPLFTRPIRASLFQTRQRDDASGAAIWLLHWSRAKLRKTEA